MQRMRTWFLRASILSFVLFAQACVKVRVNRGTESAAAVSAATTTIVVVRHAEKSTDDPRDPSISDLGKERAQALSAALKDAGIGAIYATQYKRTRQTAEPVAQRFGVSIAERTVTTSPTYAADLAREVLGANSGKSVLIVGHSNTVPGIVQALSGKAVAAIQDHEYDHMFIVVISPDSGARLYNVRFGRPTP